MVSCHYCKDEKYIPTLFYYFESFVSLANINWIYSSPSEDSIKNFDCHKLLFYLPQNCLI